MQLLRRLSAILFLLFFSVDLSAQSNAKTNKPYKVLTNGREITVKSNKNLKYVMIWTTGGNRVVEQKNINDNNLQITLPIYRKAFFLMVCLEDGKVYTEKIGLN